jgi:serB: phosphoserine phosphatase SerB
MVRLLPKMSR